MKKKRKKIKEEVVSGIGEKIFYDDNYEKVYVELTKYSDLKIPCIRLIGRKNGKIKKLIRLHMSEAIRLKSAIDQLMFDWLDMHAKKFRSKKKCAYKNGMMKVFENLKKAIESMEKRNED